MRPLTMLAIIIVTGIFLSVVAVHAANALESLYTPSSVSIESVR